MEKETAPAFLYKILALENWTGSQGQTVVKLSEDDQDFIHLATEEQLEKIQAKYWRDVPVYIILKIRTAKLLGKLVLEANPGGTNQYYHLYRGFIPLEAVEKAQVMKSNKL